MSEESVSRVQRSKEVAKANYDRMSRWYDIIAGGAEKKFRELGLWKLGAQDNERILEIGFGTGHSLLALARTVGDTGKIYGIDISQGMCSVAYEKLTRAGYSSRAELCLGDASNLPIEACIFDAIFMSFTLELFDTPDIPIVLQECLRVLRNGGRICIVGLSMEVQNWSVRIYEQFHRLLPNFVDCRPIRVRQSLIAVGFRITHFTLASMWSLPVEIVLAEKV